MAAEESNRVDSEKGGFTLVYQSELQPLEINQIHSWQLTLLDKSGNPVSGALLEVEGGMPAHNHGLATEPVIEEVGSGIYRMSGMRFHMMGYWELEFTVTYNGESDSMMLPLDL